MTKELSMSKKFLLLCFFNPFIDIIGYITNHLFRCIHIRRVTKYPIDLQTASNKTTFQFGPYCQMHKGWLLRQYCSSILLLKLWACLQLYEPPKEYKNIVKVLTLATLLEYL